MNERQKTTDDKNAQLILRFFQNHIHNSFPKLPPKFNRKLRTFNHKQWHSMNQIKRRFSKYHFLRQLHFVTNILHLFFAPVVSRICLRPKLWLKIEIFLRGIWVFLKRFWSRIWLKTNLSPKVQILETNCGCWSAFGAKPSGCIALWEKWLFSGKQFAKNKTQKYGFEHGFPGNSFQAHPFLWKSDWRRGRV